MALTTIALTAPIASATRLRNGSVTTGADHLARSCLVRRIIRACASDDPIYGGLSLSAAGPFQVDRKRPSVDLDGPVVQFPAPPEDNGPAAVVAGVHDLLPRRMLTAQEQVVILTVSPGEWGTNPLP
jgi:hypothetical protein